LARPQKEGLDYFPLDTDMDLKDDKVQLVEAKYGVVGFGVLIKLLMKIYSEGYCYQWGENEGLLFSKRVNVDINTVNDVVNDLAKWGMFDADIYKKYGVLTSNGIQKRFWEVAKRRNDVIINKAFWVHDVDNILVSANINLINVDGGTQRKEKKRKEKDSKEKCAFEIAVDDFIEFRKKIRKPMTDRAVELLRKKLDELASDDEAKIAIINQSILKGWQGVFPLSQEQKQPVQMTSAERKQAEYDKAKREADEMLRKEGIILE
jgi:hypothetical protein